MREALLELAAHAVVVAEEIARDEQEIEEIELARSRLHFFVRIDDALELDEEARREIGIGPIEQLLELFFDAGAAIEHVLAAEAFGLVVPLAGSLPAPALVSFELTEHRFDRVV